MTSAQVVETSNSPSQDYTQPDDHNLRTYDMTPGFKSFTVKRVLSAAFRGDVAALVRSQVIGLIPF